MIGGNGLDDLDAIYRIYYLCVFFNLSKKKILHITIAPSSFLVLRMEK
jgi:hypothetical protein